MSSTSEPTQATTTLRRSPRIAEKQGTSATATTTTAAVAEPALVSNYTCYVCHILQINDYTELCDEPHDGLDEGDCICSALPDPSYNYLCAACMNL